MRYFYIILLFILLPMRITAQEGGHYFPYEMPGHSAVKFNSYLMNPAFPIMGLEESHIAFYHRNQWLNYNNHFTANALSYGKKWTEQNMFHGMLFQKKAGVFSNYGLLGNYIHQIEISDDNYLRLGVNAMVGISGISKGNVIVNQQDDPLLANMTSSGMININPGFDMNFGMIHFGISAENLLDYAFSSGEMAVPFADKSLTGHLMYRYEMLSGYGMLEEAVFTAMAKVRRTSENMQLGGHAMLDMPTLGWVYAGYDQKYGMFGGLGFNVSPNFSASFGYEQGIGSYVSNLGGTYELNLIYQFGGDRHLRAKKLKETVRAKEQAKEEERKRLANAKEKPEKPKETPKTEIAERTTPTTPTTPAVTEKPKEERVVDPIKELETRLRVREDRIASERLPVGYYVIVNVFRDPRNAYRYIQEMQKQGEKVSGFVNPINNMTYVYVENSVQTPNAAGELMSLYTRNRKFENIWILKVTQ